MAFPSIARYEDRNYVGICHFDVVDVADVTSVGEELDGNIADDVVLVDGASWSRVYLEDDGGMFRELWKLKEGDQYSDAVASGAIAKDRLALMPNLWALKGQRYLVRFTNKNGDTLLMGNLETPAMARVVRRESGDSDNIATDRNEYEMVFSLVRRLPVPFYGGTVEDPPPSGGGGNVTIRDTGDTVDVDTVTAPGTYLLPQSRIKYKDAANADAELAASNTEYASSTLRPATQIPRRELVNSTPTALGLYVTADRLVNNTVPAAPDASIKTTDNAAVVFTAPAGVATLLPQTKIAYKDAANASQSSAGYDTTTGGGFLLPDTEVPRREIKNRNGTGMGVYASLDALIGNTLPNAPVPLKFAWAAGDADTYTWTVTDDEAGSYTTYTDDGGSGTITYNKNGAGFAALSGTIALAASDTIVLRRTTTTGGGWSKWV